MSDRFNECLQLTLEFEGGYSNDPNDAGGATNLGITQTTLTSAYNDGIVSHNDITKITTAEAALIYQINYWNKCSCDSLPKPVDFLVFDMAVNAGTATASKALQNVLNRYSNNQISEDGVIGPKTLASLEELLSVHSTSSVLKDTWLLRSISDSLLQYFETHYVTICAGKTEQQIKNRTFLLGWMNRNLKRATIAGESL